MRIVATNIFLVKFKKTAHLVNLFGEADHWELAEVEDLTAPNERQGECVLARQC